MNITIAIPNQLRRNIDFIDIPKGFLCIYLIIANFPMKDSLVCPLTSDWTR